jgi:Retrotransposon gag protein
MPKTERFSGKSADDNEIGNWIFAMDNLFVACGAALNDSQQLAYAVGYLFEDALAWWQAVRCSQDEPKSWSAIKFAMLEYFASPTKVSDAKDELLALTQKGAEGINEYVARFQRLFIMAQITNESDKVYAFIRGLRRFTAGSVRMHKPGTLIEAMSLAAEFEGAFKGHSAPKGSKRAADFECHSRDGKRTKSSAFHGFNQGSGKRSPYQSGKGKSRGRSSSGKSTAQRYRKNPAEIEALRRQKACFACGQKGHTAQGCTSKN